MHVFERILVMKKTIFTDVLRNDMGVEGMVVSDAMNMVSVGDL